MARQRIHATELARLFDSAPQPIYVLDDELTVVFCNGACRDWLGPAAEDLIGRRCLYRSDEAAGADATAAGLCPPPSVTEGQAITAHVSRPADQGEAAYRHATFIPLPVANGPIGIVAILGDEDLRDPPAAPPDGESSESIELHEHVRRLRRQTALRHGLDRLLGTSPAIRRARRQAELAAGSRASVLLVGPAGSGRQHLATAIHYGINPDCAGTLVPLACSLLGAELIHSTISALAVGRPLGDGPGQNTLLLNDADRLPSEIQAELAKVFSARTFSLRLIATVEEPLGELARRGRYREDLAAILSTITIELPPLAQRREDVPLLAQAFVEEANARGGKQVVGFTSEAMDRLDAYAWPGNVDELARMVAEAHQRAGGPQITVGELPERLRLAAEAAARPRRKEETIVLDEFLARIERELIRRALARARGNKAKAARLLGLTRPRLYRRMVQLGLENEGA